MPQEIYYKKYRPSQLAHIIGQDVVVKILTKSCSKEFFHHFYLMAGKHGTGKTSTARILASILTCFNRQPGSAVVCGKCPACLASKGESASVDIYELDGASSSKIESTRQIIESSHYAPQEFKFKVFIIDECHRLSPAAMSSLLKTLEEPPQGSVFILCTSEISQLPATILSRCQTCHFKPVPPAVISAHLTRLFAAKKIEIEQLAIDSISSACRGSVRDAMEMAQEVAIMYDGKKINSNEVAQFIGIVGKNQVYELVEAIADKNMMLAFDVLEQMVSSNINIRNLCEELSYMFRNIMVSKIDSKFIYDLTKTEQIFVSKIKDKFEIREIAGFLSYFEESEKAFEVNINNRWVLEALLVKTIDR
jgi:DNA polymerase-3 subunit gamma/tau